MDSPPPCGGGDGGGGRCWRAWTCHTNQLRPPSPTLPTRGGGKPLPQSCRPNLALMRLRGDERQAVAGRRWRRDVTGENLGDGALRGPGLPDAEAALVPGRGCGSCSLCCKVLPVRELDKPAGRWCIHAVPGSGCAVHAARPSACRQFFCAWRLDSNLGPEWKPDVCRFVLALDPACQALMVMVDPGRPLAWKREPYYSRLKQFSEASFRLGKKVLVDLKGDITVMLPDRE